MNSSTVLLVDDERNLARAIKAYLAENGYETEVAYDAESALPLLATLRPDVVITDVRLPGMNGLELLKRIRDFDPSISIVVMTAHGSIEGAVEAVKLGAFDYVKKPIDLEELKLLADRARENALLRQELSYYRKRDASREEPFADVMGSSPAMQALLEQARQIAALDETPPVLITGETGTGKGLVARTIHASSSRSNQPFIDVNCTAIPASLMEAELFGHERGAFTDAKQSRVGLFEAAEGGFIFLDEIGDLELALQGKLLRAIEDRVVRRVGGVRDRKIDVRILSATNRDLEREVERERFRRDLFFRLAVIPLRLPPLRERGGDVLILAEHYLQRFSAKYGKDVRTISSAAQQLMLTYPWPGNVRELSHVIERAVLWSKGPEIGVDHLSLTRPVEESGGQPERRYGGPTGTGTGEFRGAEARDEGSDRPRPDRQSTPGLTLDEVERNMLEQALRDTAGNQTRAAQQLGISRDTLRYRMKKYGLGTG